MPHQRRPLRDTYVARVCVFAEGACVYLCFLCVFCLCMSLLCCVCVFVMCMWVQQVYVWLCNYILLEWPVFRSIMWIFQQLRVRALFTLFVGNTCVCGCACMCMCICTRLYVRFTYVRVCMCVCRCLARACTSPMWYVCGHVCVCVLIKVLLYQCPYVVSSFTCRYVRV